VGSRVARECPRHPAGAFKPVPDLPQNPALDERKDEEHCHPEEEGQAGERHGEGNSPGVRLPFGANVEPGTLCQIALVT
jgi:hypothetical protein